MYYDYVIQSVLNKSFYVGMAKDVENRLKEHNNGKSKYTSSFLPWEVVYFEGPFPTQEARKREKYLKSAAGKRFLKSKIDSSNEGSLPE